MLHLQRDNRATLVSALLGSGLYVLLIFGWPRPILDWMRVFVPDWNYPVTAKLVFVIAVVFIVFAFLLAIAVVGIRWVLRRLKITGLVGGFAVVLVSTFVLAFVAEAASQIHGARGNLTASDATGLIIDEARLTLHGWETIARRAVVASLYAGIIAATYCVAKLPLRAHRDHT